eukprot:TRINITY_DN62375_c0_g1_i1.p1 TRINITY_DN62375_c0_g1~~TRINITY_DN62375_c0_g1_i1.p1  ORF type:complete len:258 (-),score=38.53 TRINITY_DN62375_c0_g1_i1:447-1142(-)
MASVRLQIFVVGSVLISGANAQFLNQQGETHAPSSSSSWVQLILGERAAGLRIDSASDAGDIHVSVSFLRGVAGDEQKFEDNNLSESQYDDIRKNRYEDENPDTENASAEPDSSVGLTTKVATAVAGLVIAFMITTVIGSCVKKKLRNRAQARELDRPLFVSRQPFVPQHSRPQMLRRSEPIVETVSSGPVEDVSAETGPPGKGATVSTSPTMEAPFHLKPSVNTWLSYLP